MFKQDWYEYCTLHRYCTRSDGSNLCLFQISVEIVVYCNVVLAAVGRLPVSLSGGPDLPLVPVVSYVTVSLGYITLFTARTFSNTYIHDCCILLFWKLGSRVFILDNFFIVNIWVSYDILQGYTLAGDRISDDSGGPSEPASLVRVQAEEPGDHVAGALGSLSSHVCFRGCQAPEWLSYLVGPHRWSIFFKQHTISSSMFIIIIINRTFRLCTDIIWTLVCSITIIIFQLDADVQ